jgi:hypothetical protein
VSIICVRLQIGMCRENLVERTNVSFHGIPLTGSRVVLYIQIRRWTSIGSEEANLIDAPQGCDLT